MIIRNVDLETTGLDAADEVIEVAFYDINDGKLDINSGRSALVRPAGLIPPVSSAVHHLTNLDVKDAKSWADTWRILVETRDDGEELKFAAHMASFERQWLDKLIKADWIDTWRCSLRQWPEFESHSLQACRYELALPVDSVLAAPPHRAAPDAYVCAMLLLELLKHQTVDTLITWSAEPPLFAKFDFGKLRGQPLSAADDGYLDWLANKEHTMGDDWRWNAKREVQRRADAPRLAQAAARTRYLEMSLAALPGAATVADLRNWYTGQTPHFAEHGILVGTDEYDVLIKACEQRKADLERIGEPGFSGKAVAT